MSAKIIPFPIERVKIDDHVTKSNELGAALEAMLPPRDISDPLTRCELLSSSILADLRLALAHRQAREDDDAN